MYINFWYPVGRGEDLVAGAPLAVQVLGLPFVAFRDGDGGRTCAERHLRASGRFFECRKDQRRLHRMPVSRLGICGRRPVYPRAVTRRAQKPPARAKVDSYPVEERYGIVFAFLGDLPEDERPPIYDVEEFGADGWKSELYILEVNCFYERSIENGLDPIHNEFVHPLQGAPMMDVELQGQPLPVTEIPWGTKFFMPFSGKGDENTALASQRTGTPTGEAGSWHQGPNQLVTWIEFTLQDDGVCDRVPSVFFRATDR